MLFSLLKKPYPYNDSPGSKWRITILIGLFISLFLVVFKPFGLGYVKGDYSNLVILGYGPVTMILLILNLFVLPFVFKRFFKDENWFVYKEILWVLFIVFTIGLGNFTYTRLIFSYPEFNFSGILSFQFITLIIALIPVSALILISQNRLLKRNLDAANLINNGIINQPDLNISGEKPEKISLFAENQKDKIEFDLSDLIFIESFGNYIKVYYSEENEGKNQVLRSTLKRIQSDLSVYKNLFQCHRAYLVNTSNIINVSGNAQGYKLSLNNTDFEVPVARSYIKEFNVVMN